MIYHLEQNHLIEYSAWNFQRSLLVSIYVNSLESGTATWRYPAPTHVRPRVGYFNVDLIFLSVPAGGNIRLKSTQKSSNPCASLFHTVCPTKGHNLRLPWFIARISWSSEANENHYPTNHKKTIVRTHEQCEIHTISNEVVCAWSVTRLKAEWQITHGPPSWRLCGLHTGHGFLLLSHDLIMDYSLVNTPICMYTMLTN